MTPTTPPEPVFTSHLALLVQSLLSELETAVRARVSTVPPFPPPPDARIAVLFSGGLDCTVVALVLDRVLPEGEAVDLINVAFENPRKLRAKEGLKGKAKATISNDDAMDVDDARGNGVKSESPAATARDPKIYDVPDRLTARNAWEELKRLRPKRRWNLVEVDVPYQEMLAHRQTVIDLMRPQNTVMDLVRLLCTPEGDAADASAYTEHIYRLLLRRTRRRPPLAILFLRSFALLQPASAISLPRPSAPHWTRSRRAPRRLRSPP